MVLVEQVSAVSPRALHQDCASRMKFHVGRDVVDLQPTMLRPWCLGNHTDTGQTLQQEAPAASDQRTGCLMHRSKGRSRRAASPSTQTLSGTSTHPASQRRPGIVCRLVLGQLLLCDLAGPDPTCCPAVSVTNNDIICGGAANRKVCRHQSHWHMPQQKCTSKAWLGFC